MNHTTTITTGGGNIRHHNAIATEPAWILCTNLDGEVPKLILHEDDRKSIFQLVARDYNFLDIKISWLR